MKLYELLNVLSSEDEQFEYALINRNNYVLLCTWQMEADYEDLKDYLWLYVDHVSQRDGLLAIFLTDLPDEQRMFMKCEKALAKDIKA